MMNDERKTDRLATPPKKFSSFIIPNSSFSSPLAQIHRFEALNQEDIHLQFGAVQA